jgi:hypothetical protein
MEKNWGNSSIVKWKLYCDVNIFQEKALKLEILYNTLHWTFYVIILLSTRLHTFLFTIYWFGYCDVEKSSDHRMIFSTAVPFAVKTRMYVQKCMQPSWKWNNHIKCPVQGIIQNFQFKCLTFLYIHSCFYCEGNCCAEDHSMIAWFLNVAVPKSVYCIILEKNSNFILYRPNKEICLFLRNLNLNMCAIWFPV